jgi:hypothetical protein
MLTAGAGRGCAWPGLECVPATRGPRLDTTRAPTLGAVHSVVAVATELSLRSAVTWNFWTCLQ